MTSPESLVVSLEMAKRLKEAGWKDGCYFWWREGGSAIDPMVVLCSQKNGTWIPGRPYMTSVKFFPAPTAEEILRRLPRFLPWKDNSDNMSSLFVNVFQSTYRVGYSPQWTNDVWSSPDAETLADAAAGCWLYLKENNLLPPQSHE